jgi:ubiquinone/menaquinone biosynthesis C-methylase UbiE/tetratricopeptide (TPR) repeat protein
MNRKERRAGLKRGIISANVSLPDGWDKTFTIDDLMAKARWHQQQRQLETARDICNRILARELAHVPALNLLGLIYQETGRHKLAVKALEKAVASDASNAACHYNLASSCQVLDREEDATVHFQNAIALGMSQKNIEDFIFQNPTITAIINRIDETWPLPVKADELLGRRGLESITDDIFLRCVLETVLVRTEPLERFLTFMRSALLGFAYSPTIGLSANANAVVRLFSAMAQQCFINEYVFVQSGEEARHSSELRDSLLQKSAEGTEIAPLLLAAVAAYFPLHSLSAGRVLLNRKWPQIVATLVDRQLREPLAEADDLVSIPVLTAVDDNVSLQVMQQYAENPYPRWTINQLAAFADEGEMPAASAGDGEEILIAGCGSGQHALQVAQNFPGARILAADISLPSLAYARRKTREEGLRNVEYVQADILHLGTIGRSFDRVEAVGVLHHLAEPELGWRVLLSLLRPNGEMRVGLYSETARRDIVSVRAFIAERGFGSTAEDIRKCRQEILRNFDSRRWKGVIESSDFYSMSGCRDLLFNVMEHRFTISEIKVFLNEQHLSFQGFEVNPWVLEKFQTLYPGAAALTDLDNWQAFEADNPLTFRHMYVFTVRKD